MWSYAQCLAARSVGLMPSNPGHDNHAANQCYIPRHSSVLLKFLILRLTMRDRKGQPLCTIDLLPQRTSGHREGTIHKEGLWFSPPHHAASQRTLVQSVLPATMRGHWIATSLNPSITRDLGRHIPGQHRLKTFTDTRNIHRSPLMCMVYNPPACGSGMRRMDHGPNPNLTLKQMMSLQVLVELAILPSRVCLISNVNQIYIRCHRCNFIRKPLFMAVGQPGTTKNRIIILGPSVESQRADLP